jgi:predicted nucleotidyltransferase
MPKKLRLFRPNSGINTVNFLVSLVTFYTLNKARNGAIVAVMELLESITIQQFILFILAALITGSIAAILTLKLAKVASNVRGEQKKSSDIDVVIDFNGSLLKLVGIERELKHALKKKVDLLTYKGLSPYLKKKHPHRRKKDTMKST